MYGNGYETPISISWGNGSSISEIQNMISNARIVAWKRNTFEVPRCTVGKSLLKLICLFDEYNHKTTWEPVALDLVCIFLPLMLQKPSARSKNADHVRYLKKRLDWWKEGNLSYLLSECEEIQRKLKKSSNLKRKQDSITIRYSSEQDQITIKMFELFTKMRLNMENAVLLNWFTWSWARR